MIINDKDNFEKKEQQEERPRADTVTNSFGLGAPSPYNYNNSKMKTMYNGTTSFGVNNNPFGQHRSMNAIVPSSSFTSKFGHNNKAAD